MSTTLPTEVLSLISSREDAILSILDLCDRIVLLAPTEAEFAAMTTDEILNYEAALRVDLEAQYDIEQEWLAMRMAEERINERIDEGFDPYMGAYTDDC